MCKKIAIYGKGGIGKSTIASNISMSLLQMGFRVLQFGCDPKSDSTSTLRKGKHIPTVLDFLRDDPSGDVHNVIYERNNGLFCVEAGGPIPGVGCAGRGIITAIEQFNINNIFKELDLDYVIFDVLGDVVCGGFAMPIRNHVADLVYTISSADFMSIYAANNLMKGISRYSNSNGALFGGIIANSINLDYQREMIFEYAQKCSTNVLNFIPRSVNITKAELNHHTIVEEFPNSSESKIFQDLACSLVLQENGIIPNPCSEDELYLFSREWSKKILEKTYYEQPSLL